MNMFPMKSSALAALLLLAGGAAHAAAMTERLVVIANGENVGSVVATTEGRSVAVDYAVNDNGRGPKQHVTLTLGANEVPVAWTVQGTSLMGGAVNESFRWQAGTASWKSQADAGEVAAPQAPLYVLNDDSPWALGVYARALLKSKTHSIGLLPSGTMRLFEVGKRRVGEGAKAVDLKLYRLEGIQLSPSYVFLDGKGRLFAAPGGFGITVREGYEAQAAELKRAVGEADQLRAGELQARLAHRYDAPVRLRHVKVFDPRTGQVGQLSTVVVMRDRITGILPDEPDSVAAADQVIIDGQGGVLVPGLHDMHSHTSLNSGLFYLAAGVTATRDMGNDNAFLQWLLPQIEAGKLAGPRITPNGLLEGRSPFSLRIGAIPESLEDAQRWVDWYADRGYFQIKIYNSMNPDWVRPIVEMAKRRGMGVTGHVPAFDTPDRVIADGYGELTHLNQLVLGWLLKDGEDTRTALRLTALARAATLDLDSAPVQKTVQTMVDGKIPLDPTIVVIERLMLSRAGKLPPGDVDTLDHLPIGIQRYRKRTFVPLKSEADDQAYFAAFDKLLDTLRMLHARGIQLLPGTDDETGFTVHRELELYTKAGFTPAEALRADTLDAAEYLKQGGRRGSIERGKDADFFLIADDPTQDIRAIKKARLVFKGGAVYQPSEIYEALSIKPFAATPPIRVPAASAGAAHSNGGGAFFSQDSDADDEPHLD